MRTSRRLAPPRAAGYTLVEVLVALALAGAVVLVAVRALAGAHAVDGSLSAGSTAARALDLGTDLLAGELRRAGYAPYPNPDADWAPSPGLTLEIGADGAHGDTVGVRYLDDRLASGTVERDLRFDVAVDGRGVPQLYRRTASGNRQPLVQGVTSFRLVAWADAAGLHQRDELVAGTLSPWLLVFSLTADRGPPRTVAAALPSRPEAQVTVGP